MDFSTSLLGKRIAEDLQARVNAPILRIGRDSFSRSQLAGVACFNFIAAQTLSAILNDELNVKDTREVFNTITPADLALPRLGAVALAVLGAAFEVHGLGGDAPLTAWANKHLGKDDTLVTFATTKAQRRRTRKGRK